MRIIATNSWNDCLCAGFWDAGIDEASHVLMRLASEKRQDARNRGN